MSVARKQEVKWRSGGVGPAGNPQLSQISFAPSVARMGRENHGAGPKQKPKQLLFLYKGQTFLQNGLITDKPTTSSQFVSRLC